MAICVDCDESRIDRRIEHRYLDTKAADIDEALALAVEARDARRPLSIGLVGNAAEVFPELLERDAPIDIVTDQTSAHDPLSYLPTGVLFEDMKKMAEKDPVYFTEQARDSMAKHVKAMVGFMDKGAEVFDYGNSIRDEARKAGYDRAFDFPGFVPAYIRPQFEEGLGPFRWAALSGDPKDIEATDRAILELFPDNAHLRRWITMAEERVAYQGLPARICWLGYGERHRAGLKFNEMVASGELSAPIVIGRDHLDSGSVASPYRETEAMADGSDAIADWPLLNALVNTASGASWVSIHHGGGVGMGRSIHAGQVCVADGTELAAQKLERVLINDPGMGVIRHADAGYEHAIAVAAERGVRIPMQENVIMDFDAQFDSLWESILDVGREPATGGYRRFAWTTADLTLREWFTAEAQRRGMTVEEDRNGNMWAWWMPAGWSGDPRGAFVTGSHLDSVPDGGAFDGPLGVVSAFHAVDLLRARGVAPVIPVAVVAFADEEGARFGVACVGSQLSTGALTADRALALRDNDGTTLADALRDAGRRPEQLGADDTLTERVGVYVELHVEQGRALQDLGRPVAVASSIWPHGRWHLTFGGEANHAGTTRLVDRRDPMLPFASAVHAARIEAGRTRRRRHVRKGQGQPERRERHSVPCRCVAGRPRRRRGHPRDSRRIDPGRGRALCQGRPRHHGLRSRVDHPDCRVPGCAAPASAGGAVAVRRGSRPSDRRGPRRRNSFGQGADGNVVRAQPHRGVSFPRGVCGDR